MLLTTAGSLIWNSLFVVAGYLLGEQWHRIESVAGWASNAVVAAIVVLLAVFLGRRAYLEFREQREHRDAPRG